MTRETEPTAPDTGTSAESASGSGESMAEISHTNPYTDESTGQLFSRGPVVAADGGEADAVESTDDRPERAATDERTMRTVSHTPPTEATETNRTNRVFERGRVRTDGIEDDR
ncbi:hypothetical protein [Halostagnicola kamekurae]|uniref:Uncharacterized protein n=1 Tax=Halostagnicola kamekurae TaxID=619731 RepID=A0A1I6SCE7_9EURY|nr:hypothetical protein [Halostagnicola kamekurae]SFS74631.1 hypothetical protein SAMN04488556_2565 [Halostagnicola kamekurae]